MSIACCLVSLYLGDGGDARAGILAVVQGPGDTPFCLELQSYVNMNH